MDSRDGFMLIPRLSKGPVPPGTRVYGSRSIRDSKTYLALGYEILSYYTEIDYAEIFLVGVTVVSWSQHI